jgi:protein-tyrosine phosphatase
LKTMWTKLHWAEGPWHGKLAVAARPRGGEWLADEIATWRHAGIGTVLSLLTREEEQELDLTDERRQVTKSGIKFMSLPIPDRRTPGSEAEVKAIVEELDSDLSDGNNVVIHCRQGVGRSGLLAACVLISKGLSAGAAVEVITAARGVAVPETPEQRRWIDQFATTFAGAK